MVETTKTERPDEGLTALARRVAELEASEALLTQANEALRISEARYRSWVDDVLDSSQVGIIILDPKLMIVWVNQSLECYFGLRRDEVTGKDMRWLVLDRLKHIVENARGVVEKLLAKCDNNEYAGRLECHVLPGHAREEWWLEHWSQPIRSGTYAGGRVEHFTDITDRKMAEEALQCSEERYRTLVDEMDDGFVATDTQGAISFANKALAGLFGFESPRDIIGMSFLEFVAPEDKDEIRKHFDKAVNALPVGLVEHRVIRKDGSIRVVQWTSSRVVDKDESAATRTVVRDITERRLMEEQLIVTDRLASVGELAAGIAHELNNPLTSVIGFSQLLLDKEAPEDVKKDLKVVSDEALRAAGVIKNLLTFARRHPPAKQMVNINSIAEKVLQIRAYEQKVSNINVIARLATDLPEIRADYFQLQQVFLNIIINAEYFMFEAHKGGTLTITTEKVGSAVRASFGDDGPGVSKGSLGRIFEPFFTTKEVGKGTGLGLSICHGIIAGHGGRIWAESQLGKGANFIVELPLTETVRKER